MSGYPNLKGIATTDLVEKVGGSSYSASYINWSRTMQMLRDHAPGWLPELMFTAEGGYVHSGGVGGFLMIRFVHQDGPVTPGFPQAIMDNRNAAIPLDKITARDITDTHRRGVCMAAAMAFGLAYELWAKMPLESGFAEDSSGSGPAEPQKPPERRTEAPAPLKPPTTWSKLTEMVAAYDEGTHDTFFAFADAARRLEFPDSENTAALNKQDKAWLFQKCAGAALHLREAFDPNEAPPPGLEDVRTAFAAVLDGQELAIPDEVLDAETAEAAEREA